MAELEAQSASSSASKCFVCFSVSTVPGNLLLKEPAHSHIAFHLDHLFDEKAKLKCLNHRETLSILCSTCNKLMCYKCSTDIKHRYHTCRRAETKFEEMKAILGPLRLKVTECLEQASHTLSQLNTSQDKLTQQKLHAQKEIEEKFQRNREDIDKKKKSLLAHLEMLYSEQEKFIITKKEELNDVRVQVSSCVDSIKKHFSEAAVTGISELVQRAVGDLVQSTITSNNTVPNIRCAISSVHLDSWKVYIQEVCPENCYAEGEGLTRATLNRFAMFDLHTRNSDNKPCENPVACQCIECELVHEESSVSLQAEVRQQGEANHYVLKYQPKLTGNHMLHVRIENSAIKESPFQVSVCEIQCPVATITDLQGPWGVAIGRNGQLIVAENGANRISFFSSERRRESSFGLPQPEESASNPSLPTTSVRGITAPVPSRETSTSDAQGATEVVASAQDKSIAPNQLPSQDSLDDLGCGESEKSVDHRPSGVVVDPSGNILVANRCQHCVMKFQEDGKLVKYVGNRDTFLYPSGITFNLLNNKIYVSDSHKHRIRIMNSDLSFDQVFGEYGDQDGQFVYPTSVACDSKGNVYVADNGNNRIQVFSMEGQHQRSFGQFGNRDGELCRPVAITVDSRDILYVSDRGNHRICIFTCEGRFVYAFHSKDEQSFDPSGLAVDQNGIISVCSFKQGHLKFFRYTAYL